MWRKKRKENCDGPGEENSFLHIGKLAVRPVIFFDRKLILIDRETEQGTLNCLLHLSLQGKQGISSRVIIQLTLLHAYTKAKRKRFRSQD